MGFDYWKALAEDKVIFLDQEYQFGNTKKTDWKYINAGLRIQTIKVGLDGEIEVHDVWAEGFNQWDRIFSYLEQGYILVAHSVIAEIRADLCDERILKYAFNGQLYDTYVAERLIHGLNNPIGDYITKKVVKTEDGDFEDGEDDIEYSAFALDDLVFRWCGIKLPKLYQDARNWLRKDLPEALLDYCKDDVKYLPKILKGQLKAIKEMKLEEQVWLNNELVATSYVMTKWGISINRQELNKYLTEYTQKAEELEQKMIVQLPKVPFSDTQLIDLYFDRAWVKGQGLSGFTSKSKAIDCVKKKQNHALTSFVWNWVAQNREKLLRTPSLTSHSQRLEAFKRLGYKIESTSQGELKSYALLHEAPLLDDYIKWVEYNALLTKTLTKIQPGFFLRPDGTVRTFMNWVGTANGRSASKEMNVQNLGRSLKSLYGTPNGMIKIGFDYAAIEFYKVLNDYPEKELIDVILNPKEDIHCWMASKYFDKDYKYLLENRKDKSHEASKLRQASKTVTYFLTYKTPAEIGSKFVTGVKRLIATFESELGWALDEELAKKLIITGERMMSTWSNEKRNIDKAIKTAYQNKEKVLEFTGAMGVTYKHDILRDNLYIPAEFDEESGDLIKNEYINSRTIYSQLIAGPIAVGAKQAVRMIQKELFDKFGMDRARLVLFVHDSIDVYAKPEIAEEVKEIIIRNMLKCCYHVSGFNVLPISVEGGIEGEPEEKYTYDGLTISKS